MIDPTLIARMVEGWRRIVAGVWGPPRVGGRQLSSAPDIDMAGEA